MLSNIKTKRQEGFTIIEVMIVLAIAALILLVVLLAVPALQRNSRNTAMKSDANTVAGAVSTFEGNNSGTVPVYVAGTGSVAIDTAQGATSNRETAKVQTNTVVNTVNGAPTTALADGTISYLKGSHCSIATGGSGATDTRAAAVYFNTETGGSPGKKLSCQEV